MAWFDEINHYLDQLTAMPITSEIKAKIVSVMDLTSLNATDTEKDIFTLCEKSHTIFGDVAALCVYPKFVPLVKKTLKKTIKIDTVANFPTGDESLEQVLLQIKASIKDGADEIDVVFPYCRFLNDDRHYVINFVSACRAACGESITLKVILETGAFPSLEKIVDACKLLLQQKVDFVKTATGKIAQGVTLETAACLLLTIRDFNQMHNQVLSSQRKRESMPVGIKISGGIRTLSQAVPYLQLADAIMGKGWVNKKTFRFGSSKLIDEIY